MAKKTTPKTGSESEDPNAEKERLEILSKASTIKGEQLFASPEGISSKKEMINFALGNIDNPDKKFDVYYRGINRLLKKHLPKGKENKKARDYIYEEKNVYLTRGKRKKKDGTRGGDGRMGYITDGEEILSEVIDWIFAQDTPVGLYNRLRDLNIKMGYGRRRVF